MEIRTPTFWLRDSKVTYDPYHIFFALKYLLWSDKYLHTSCRYHFFSRVKFSIQADKKVTKNSIKQKFFIFGWKNFKIFLRKKIYLYSLDSSEEKGRKRCEWKNGAWHLVEWHLIWRQLVVLTQSLIRPMLASLKNIRRFISVLLPLLWFFPYWFNFLKVNLSCMLFLFWLECVSWVNATWFRWSSHFTHE